MPDYLATFRTRLLHAEALVELARGQHELASAGDYDGLLESLQRKQRIIDRMADACDEHVRREWMIDRDDLDAAERRECDALLAASQQRLDETLEHERTAIATVTAAREKVNADLHSLTAARQTQAGYAGQDTPPQRSLLDLTR